MKKIFTLLTLIFIFLSDLYSQSISPEWAVRFNSNESAFDFATNMAVDSAGNVYVTGKSWGDGTEYDYSTIKYNTAGVLQWEARYNGPGNYTDEPTGIAVDKNGNVYVTGFSYGGSSDYDYATIKYNSGGVQQWVDRYNGSADSTDNPNSIVIDVSGNIYVTGKSMKLGSGGYSNNFDCVTIKYNSLGLKVWTRNYEWRNGDDDLGKFIKTDISGNVYIVGGEGEIDMLFALYVLKYNSVGTLQWTRIEENMGIINPISTSLDNFGNLYIANDYIPDRDSCLIIKYNNSGIKQWIATPYGLVLKSFAVDSSGNSYLTGSRPSYGGPDIITLKYNSSGVQQWYERYSGPSYIPDEAISLSLDISGNVYVVGLSLYPSTGYDLMVLKYNSSGIKQWVSRYIATEENPKVSGIDYSGNLYITGTSVGFLTEYDYSTLKYPNSLQLNANILLEGFYNGSTNSLNKKDTITAYIRNTFYPYALIDSGKAVIDTNTFRCGFCFNHAAPGTYYISLKHRNSLETWSKDGGEVFVKSSPTYYDFTTISTQAFGNNLKLKESKYCFYSGDVNQDGYITSFDALLIYNDAINFIAGNFLSTDLNGDGIVDLADKTICYNNSINFVSVIRP